MERAGTPLLPQNRSEKRYGRRRSSRVRDRPRRTEKIVGINYSARNHFSTEYSSTLDLSLIFRICSGHLLRQLTIVTSLVSQRLMTLQHLLRSWRRIQTSTKARWVSLNHYVPTAVNPHSSTFGYSIFSERLDYVLKHPKSFKLLLAEDASDSSVVGFCLLVQGVSSFKASELPTFVR